MDNRRLILAILLSWAAVMLWSFLFSPPPPEPRREEAPISVEGETAESSQRGSQSSSSGVQGAETADAPQEAVEEAVPREPIGAERVEEVVVETERYRATFSNRGAELTSFLLKGFEATEGGTLDLVRYRTGNRYPFSLVHGGLEEAPINQALFAVSREPAPGGGTILNFEYRGEMGEARKRFFLGEEGLFEIEVEYPGPRDWGLFVGPGIENPSPEELRKPQFPRRVVYDVGDGREILEAQKTENQRSLPGSTLRWVALTDSYFLSAILPARGVGEVEIHPFMIVPGEEEDSPSSLIPLPREDQRTKENEKTLREAGLVLRSSDTVMLFSSYWGAKVYEDLAELPYGLERTVNFGWFTFLARPLHLGLQWIHGNVVANYGWAIVLMTILIRLLMLPLTHQSMKSMQKMQELNPKMQAIRAKYRPKLKDKQGRPNLEAQKAMNDEIMGLYRSEGVNPAGGCVPILLQFPVFLAFYGLLGGAIELRHAPWILWIQDLSVADPYLVLPTVMGITQLIQQLRMPMGGDPLQRKLFLLMPVIFWFVFLKFPAGLVLYWLTNNVFGIAQQEVYRKIRGEAGNTTAVKSPPGKAKKSGKTKKG